MPPAPTFTSPEQQDRAAVIQYASTQVQYISDRMLADEQILFAPGQSRGPDARIESAAHAGRISDSALARGTFIARIVSTGPYAPIRLVRGIQYLWVDSSASGWRAVVVPANAASPARVIKVSLFTHAGATRIGSVRWFYTSEGTLPNPKCGTRCCVPCDPTIAGMTCPDPTQWMLRPGQLPSYNDRTPADPIGNP
jgi:hypothetical protein